jgi:flagella basal body P-ring formation protein FlgA
MVAILLALHAVSGLTPSAQDVLPGVVSESLTRALAVPGARIVPLSWSAPANCPIRNASVAHAIDGSGRVAVKFVGRACSGWGWVHLEVWAETAVTTRAVRVGEALASSFTLLEQEVRPGRMPFVPPEGAVAIRTLPSGTPIHAFDVGKSAVVAGDPIKILVVTGVLAVEAQGRRIPCGEKKACAVLASGKHLEGRMDDVGRLIVEVP